MTEGTQTTPLHDWHTARGANMAEFGGYDMPLWYSSAKGEHLAVLTAAGLFDTSHMAVVTITGPDARDLIQQCFTQDLDRCIGRAKRAQFPGRCVYGAFLDPEGGVIDDAIVYLFDEGQYMVVVNAGMGGPIADHLREHAGSRSVTVTDLTDRLGKIDLQGPAAARILTPLLSSAESVFESLPYFAFKGGCEALGMGTPEDEVRLADGTPILLSRTGYTGEFGFEIFADPDRIVEIWERIIDAGEKVGIMPCGLAARDSLRAGAVLPLSHQDIGHWPFIDHPWPFALPFSDDGSGFTKDFIGADALMAARGQSFTRPFVGHDLRKVAVTPETAVDDDDGATIGSVLTCVSDMGIGRVDGRIYSIASPDRPAGFSPRGLCCGFVKVDRDLAPGQEVTLRDQRRKIRVVIADDIRPDRTARRLKLEV